MKSSPVFEVTLVAASVKFHNLYYDWRDKLPMVSATSVGGQVLQGADATAAVTYE